MDFDASAFHALVDEIGIEDTKQTFAIFIGETDERLKRFRALRCEQDRDAIRQEAHALKGAAGNFGLPRVCDLARGLEQGAATIAPQDYEDTLRGLETSYAAARRQLVALE